MQEIGPIKRVQVQQSSLKVGYPNKYYDPSPLLVVDSLLVSALGVVGVLANGDSIIDVHNENHPQSRNRGGNSLSIGFTSHHESMRTRFGPHLFDGCAGENILVETDILYSPADLKKRLAIQKATTGEFIYLTEVEVATPCVQFSQYAAAKPLSNAQLKETLQFLHNGRRGFYTELADPRQEVSVRAGDIVFIIDDIESMDK